MDSDEWKQALDDLLPVARTKIDPRDLKPYLYEEAGGFLTEEEAIHVCGVDGDSQIERVDRLIEILKTKNVRAFLRFCSILDKINCSEIAQELKRRAFCKDTPGLESIEEIQTERYLASESMRLDNKSLSESPLLSRDSGIDFGSFDDSLPLSRSLHFLRSSTLQSSVSPSRPVDKPSIYPAAEETVADTPQIAAVETNLRSIDKGMSTFKLLSLFHDLEIPEKSDLPSKEHIIQQPAIDEVTPEVLLEMNNAQETSQDYTGDRISHIHPMSKSLSQKSKMESRVRSCSNDDKVKDHRRRNTEPARVFSNITKNPSSIGSARRSISVPQDRSFSSSKPSPSPFTRDQMLLLTVPDLLAEHDKDWYDFGLMLAINRGELNKIKKRYNNDDHRCVVMLESLSKEEEMSAFSVLEEKLSKSPNEWSQKFWSAIQKKATELATFCPQLGAAICCQVNETSLAEGKPDECLIQALSNSDAVACRYWRIGRLLGLSIDAMEHIEESVTEGQLKKKVLEVFRKWQESQGGSTLCLFQVLHYLKIDLQPFVGLMNAINRTETNSATSMNDQFSEPLITTAVLTATQSEYNTVLGYFGVEQNEPPINCGVYLCNNDPTLEENPPELRTLDVNEINLKHVERLLLVTFPAVKKAFVVYQPESSKARQATSEMLHLADNYNWPLKYFYIIGSCSYFAKEPRGALGQIMLVECLDDYNQGDLTDGQFTLESNPHKMSQELFQTVFHWAENGPKLEWNVPFEHAKRVCSAPRRVRCEEVASKLLANDSCIAIETEGVGMLTVKEVVDEARSHLEYIVVKGAAHHADVHSEQTQPIRLFNQNPRECGALEREAIATLHSIVLVTRCIVLDMPRITGV